MLAHSGASVLTIHGRRRGNPDKRRTGPADLNTISTVVQNLRDLQLPCIVLSNGNVSCAADVAQNLQRTGAGGVMVGEQILRDPGLFDRQQSDPEWGPYSYGGLCLALEYAELLDNEDTGGECWLPMDDGTPGGLSGDSSERWVRNVVAAGLEFERYSVWWTNHAVVWQHLEHMLGQQGLLLITQIKIVATVTEVLQLLRKFASDHEIAG